MTEEKQRSKIRDLPRAEAPPENTGEDKKAAEAVIFGVALVLLIGGLVLCGIFG